MAFEPIPTTFRQAVKEGKGFMIQSGRLMYVENPKSIEPREFWSKIHEGFCPVVRFIDEAKQLITFEFVGYYPQAEMNELDSVKEFKLFVRGVTYTSDNPDKAFDTSEDDSESAIVCHAKVCHAKVDCPVQIM